MSPPLKRDIVIDVTRKLAPLRGRGPTRRNELRILKKAGHDLRPGVDILMLHFFMSFDQVIYVKPQDVQEIFSDNRRFPVMVEEWPEAPSERKSPLFIIGRMEQWFIGNLKGPFPFRYRPKITPSQGFTVIVLMLDRRPVSSFADSSLDDGRYRLPPKSRDEFKHEASFRVEPDRKAFALRGLFCRNSHRTLRVMQSPYILCVRSANSTCGTSPLS